MKLVWDEMTALERRVDDLFREILGHRSRLEFPSTFRFIRRPFMPSTDVFTANGDLVVELEVPGIDPKKDVTVGIEDGELIVRGERHKKEEVKEENYYRMETSFGSFERHVGIPEGTAENDIDADYGDGVLKITVHGAAKALKAEEKPKAKAIPIRTKGTK